MTSGICIYATGFSSTHSGLERGSRGAKTARAELADGDRDSKRENSDLFFFFYLTLLSPMSASSSRRGSIVVVQSGPNSRQSSRPASRPISAAPSPATSRPNTSNGRSDLSLVPATSHLFGPYRGFHLDDASILTRGGESPHVTWHEWQEYLGAVDNIANLLSDEGALIDSWRRSVIDPFRTHWENFDRTTRLQIRIRLRDAFNSIHRHFGSLVYYRPITLSGFVVSD